MDITKVKKRFEWLLTFLICNFRFVHQILGMMTKIATDDIPTMGVRVLDNGKIQLAWNPAFFDSLNDAEATYVHYHEVLHIALHHCTKRKGDILNPELWNVAQDLAVNELIPIRPGICEAPEGICLVKEFKKKPLYKEMEERQSAEYYFNYLKQRAKKINVPIGGDGKGKDGEGDGKGDGKGKDGKGEYGFGKAIDDHGGWKEHEIAAERIRAKIREISSMSLWGNIPADVQEIIKAAQIKRINWKAYMITWFGNQIWRERMTTRKRPNRRTGYIHPGYRKSLCDKWLIAADTSGSIDKDLLAEWGGVLNQLVEEIPIDFMQFDCSVQTEPKPYEQKMLDIEFKGRGGTNFEPVIDIADKKGYKGVCILTDGEAPAPSKPRNARVLWVLPVGHKPPVDWGERIILERI